MGHHGIVSSGIRVVLGHFVGRQAEALNISGRTPGQPGIVILLSRFGGWVMVGRLLSVTGTTLLIAVGLVTPVLATTTATPAAADTVVDGCTIVSNPTSTNFTNCPGADLAGADLHSFNLSFANFAGADLAGALLAACPPGIDSFCNFALLSDANLSQVNLSGAVFAAATLDELRPGSAAATFDGANLTDAILTDAVLVAYVSVGGLEYGTVADFTGATLTNANFTGTMPRPPESEPDGDQPGRGGGDVVHARRASQGPRPAAALLRRDRPFRSSPAPSPARSSTMRRRWPRGRSR